MEAKEPGPVMWLKVVAVVSLVVGVIGAVVLWSNAAETIPTDDYFGTFEEETDPFMVFMGFVSLFQGLLIWAVLMVYAAMAENVAVLATSSVSMLERTRESPA